VLHVPNPRDTGSDRIAIGGLQSIWSGTPNGAFEAYMCMRCGFTELYVWEPHALDRSKLDSSRVLVAKPPGDPYR
jgi:predicted nucleic-acid-binding Zn-ribbon protein